MFDSLQLNPVGDIKIGLRGEYTESVFTGMRMYGQTLEQALLTRHRMILVKLKRVNTYKNRILLQ